MIKTLGDIGKVKERVKALYGKDVAVKVSLGRNKFAFYNGRVTGVYPSLFTVSPVGKFLGKTTYSYAEMLCGNVFLKSVEKA